MDVTDDLKNYDVIFLAALVGMNIDDKNKVIQHLAKYMAPGAILMLRSAHGARAFLYPVVDPNVLHGFNVLSIFHPDDDVINSVVISRKFLEPVNIDNNYHDLDIGSLMASSCKYCDIQPFNHPLGHRKMINESIGGLVKALDFIHDKVIGQKSVKRRKLYIFYMPIGRNISEHIDEFNKIVLDLANIEVKFEDEDLALLLLTSLLASYKQFVDTLLYGREALTLEDVMATQNSKEIKERSKAKGDDREGLYVRGRTDHKDSRQSRGKSRSKFQAGRLKCYIFQSEDHLKRNCPKNNRKKSTGAIYRECKIRGIGKVRIQLRDGSSFVLHNVRVVFSEIRRDNYVYFLDGYAMAGELNATVEEKASLAQCSLPGSAIVRYLPFSHIIRQTNAIRNFGQVCNEHLNLDRNCFNDLHFLNYPEHKINEHEQLQILYQGLDPRTRQKADFKGPIPRMTSAARIKSINELSKHSFSWYKDKEYKKNDFDKVLKHIKDFKHNISVLNEEVRMVQHQYKTADDERDSFLKETLNSFVREAH
ncbi:retrovirus-related pol polyprotein from transposon TNT 1-94 [Tanacetum coccineum]